MSLISFAAPQCFLQTAPVHKINFYLLIIIMQKYYSWLQDVRKQVKIQKRTRACTARASCLHIYLASYVNTYIQISVFFFLQYTSPCLTTIFLAFLLMIRFLFSSTPSEQILFVTQLHASSISLYSDSLSSSEVMLDLVDIAG